MATTSEPAATPEGDYLEEAAARREADAERLANSGITRVGNSQMHAPRPPATYIFSFEPAYNYLYARLAMFDPDPAFTQAVLSIIVKEVMDYANAWCDSNSLELAIEHILRVSDDQQLAFELAKNAQDIISAQISQHFPDFGVARYSGKYLYKFIGGSCGRIQLDLYPDGAPGGGRQPPG
jgi:hypothetical protein